MNSNEFVIQKGLSSVLFNDKGECQVKLHKNYWYLTTDTAEVYVAIGEEENLQLKKINECNIDIDLPQLESFESRLDALEKEEKIHTYGYRNGFPAEGIEGHMYVAVDEQQTYIWYDGSYVTVGGNTYNVIFGGTAD